MALTLNNLISPFENLVEASNKEEKLLNIIAKDLTTQDLRASKLPNKFHIYVNFLTPNENLFRMVYTSLPDDDKKYYPRFSIEGESVSRSQFDKVLRYLTITHLGKSIRRRPTYELSNGNINALVHQFLLPFNQRFIANKIDGFNKYFKDINISGAIFKDVPLNIYQSPGFLETKLSIKD